MLITLLEFVEQGDDYDSSDAEWDQQFGGHARAFLGLNEPVAEIPLDEGVGIGTLVRNAFARADDIHERAAGPEGTSDEDADDSPEDTEMVEDANIVDAHNPHVRRVDEDMSNSQAPHMHGSAPDLDMLSSYTASLRGRSSTSADPSDNDTTEDSRGNAHRGSDSDDELCGSAGNRLQEQDVGDSSTDREWDATDSASSDGEDVEDLLGQIPNDRMGSQTDFDIAATLPLYEGSTLSCCAPHCL